MLALYINDAESWRIATYAEVVEGAFAFETAGLNVGSQATFAVVNKARGNSTATVFPSGAQPDGPKNNLRQALKTPGVYRASGPLAIAECDIKAEHGITQAELRDNDLKNLMENGIEGTYYCISGNKIDTTGYRYDDDTGDSYNGGYKTVSTEGIAANVLVQGNELSGFLNNYRLLELRALHAQPRGEQTAPGSRSRRARRSIR